MTRTPWPPPPLGGREFPETIRLFAHASQCRDDRDLGFWHWATQTFSNTRRNRQAGGQREGEKRVYKADEGSLHFEMDAGRVMGLEHRQKAL